MVQSVAEQGNPAYPLCPSKWIDDKGNTLVQLGVQGCCSYAVMAHVFRSILISAATVLVVAFRHALHLEHFIFYWTRAGPLSICVCGPTETTHICRIKQTFARRYVALLTGNVGEKVSESFRLGKATAGSSGKIWTQKNTGTCFMAWARRAGTVINELRNFQKLL